MNNFTHCGFAYPGTYGHECGKPATLVGECQSDHTKDGRFFARRCVACAQIKGGENTGISKFVPFQADVHVNQWK
jgi:hypothetical protein